LIEGLTEGKLEGELQALRLIMLDTVQDRFPDLMDFAQSQALLTKEPTSLRKLIHDLQHMPDETAVIRAFKTARQGA
jgi:hypothetical protein